MADSYIHGFFAWMWNSESELGGGVGHPGAGFNLCNNENGEPRPAFYSLTKQFK